MARSGTPEKSSALPSPRPPQRMLLTAGIMFAPQLGVGVFILLLSLGHIGTAVPLMLIWLVLDRFDGAEGTKRRWAPVIAGLLLTWALIADPLVLVVGVVPLVAVCAVRAIRGGPRWYEVALALAATLAEGLASPVNWLLRASAGINLHPVGYAPAAPCAWPKHVYVTAEGLLALFGAKPQGTPIELAFALVHLAGSCSWCGPCGGWRGTSPAGPTGSARSCSSR